MQAKEAGITPVATFLRMLPFWQVSADGRALCGACVKLEAERPRY